jgi:polycomb protein EED
MSFQGQFYEVMNFPFKNCDVWFVRFDVDFSQKKLAVGSLIGEVFVWDLEDCLANIQREPKQLYIKHPNCNCIIRKVGFSYDSK